MKLSAARPNKKNRPFVNSEKLVIITKQEKNKIVGFQVKYNGKEKYFPVKRQDITRAWKEVEAFTKTINAPLGK